MSVWNAVLDGSLVAIFLGLWVIVGLALRSPARAAAARRRRDLYEIGARERAGESAWGRQLSVAARELVQQGARRPQLEIRLEGRLEAAGLNMKPGEWMRLQAAAPIVLALLGFLLSGGRWLVTVGGAVVGIAGPMLYLLRKEGSRRQAFAAQLADTLQLIAGALTAGYSLPQAMDTAAAEAGDPIGTELQKALAETRLGAQLDDMLDTVGARMRSLDFEWVVMAIRIQREVGGNLAEILAIVAETIREREFIRRQVQVLSADGRLSAIIIGALPFVFGGALELIRPLYLRPLYTTTTGVLALVFGGVLFLVGVIWMRASIQVEV